MLNVRDDCDLFLATVCHNGFFCGFGEKLSDVSASTGYFDNCSAQTWKTAITAWIDEILKILGHERDGKLHVYWCLLSKDIRDGLVAIYNDLHDVKIIKASKTQKTLVLFVDRTNFLKIER